jgi:2,3-dihydroxy-p-cumate/2,3-dihydroxybenzoate 3,4-dioxygenase
MSIQFRDLRYVRIAIDDLEAATRYATEVAGLQLYARDGGRSYLRSDARAYSLCYSRAGDTDAVALTVASDDDLDFLASRLRAAGVENRRFAAEECSVRKIKAGLVCLAPNGVTVEFVWRPMTSGERYHGPRDAGITEFQTVSLRCTDIAANERFWIDSLGGAVSDWVGDACYVRIDDLHHRIALYPSDRDGLFGVGFAVESINNVMQNYYWLQARQLPVVHGPGRQPASGLIFVTTRGPRDVLLTFGTGMASGAEIDRRPPRQFPGVALSHCAWGSATLVPEFLGEQ